MSPRKMNLDLCPLFIPQPGDSRIRLNRKRRWSLPWENAMKKVVRKLTGSEERQEIPVKRSRVSRVDWAAPASTQQQQLNFLGFLLYVLSQWNRFPLTVTIILTRPRRSWPVIQ